MSFLKNSLILGNVALAIAAGATLQAQEVTGSLAGSVKDSNGAAVAGAQVIIRAAQLIAPRRVVTDGKGSFRAPLLPPGDYQVDVVKDGYAGQGARQLRIGVGASIRQDFILKPISQAAATVEVVSSAATLDKSDSKAATSFSAEELLTLPTAGGDRAFTGAMDFAPGVTTNAGGGTSIRGGKTQETGYTLNGTSIKDDYEGRMNSTRLIDDAVEDTQVIQSPLHARFGRTGGGMVNVVTKSGGNDFSGSIRSYISKNDWEAYRHLESRDEARANTQNRRQTDIFFSGPIWKDRVWFAISTIQKPAETSRTEILIGENPADWEAATQTGRQWDQFEPGFTAGSLYPFDIGTNMNRSDTQDYIDAKFTGSITPDHTVDFTFQQNKQEIKNRNPYGDNGAPIVATIQSHSLSQIGLDKYWSYGYRGVLGGSTFIEARYSKSISNTTFPSPLLDHLRLSYYGTQLGVLFPYGFNIAPAIDARDNQSGNLNVKQFLDFHGSHEIDAGFEFYEFLRGTQTQNGPRNLRFYIPAVTADAALVAGLNPDPYGNLVGFQAVNYYYARSFGNAAQTATGTLGQSAVLRRYYGADGISKTRTTSLYVNDSWSINKYLNVMLGLRIDKFRVEDTDKSVLIDKMGPLAPRFQIRYDPDGTTRHLFTFTAAKYVNEYSAGFTDGFIKKANTTYAQFGYTGVANAAGAATWVDYANITNLNNYGNSADGLAGPLSTPTNYFDASKNNIIEQFSNPYVIEYTLGYRRAYQNGSFFQITFVNKEWKNDFSISTDIDPAYFVMVTDPTGSGLPSRPALATKWGNSNELTRNYKAAELEFRHNINSTWLFGGNYTYSRLTGNTNGGDSGAQAFRDTTASAPLNLKGWHVRNGTPLAEYTPEGLLLSNQTHKARLYVTASLPLGKGRISYTALLRYDSGTVFGAAGTKNWGPGAIPTDLYPTTVPTNPALPSNYTAWFSQRGAFTGNDSYQVDAKIDWSLPLGFRKLQLMGNLQIDNVFNTQIRTGYVNNFITASQPYNVTGLAVANPATFGTDAGNYAYWIQARNVSASIGLKF